MIKLKIGHGPEVIGYITLDGKKIKASGDVEALTKLINIYKKQTQSSREIFNNLLNLRGYIWSEVQE